MSFKHSNSITQTKSNERSLPKDWQWVRLGDICQTTSGGTPLRGTSGYYGGNIPWVKSGELNDGFVNSTEETITELGLQNSSAKLFPAGTLLIALYGATVGRLGILNMDAATNQAVCAIFTSDEIDKNYLFHYLLSKREELVDISFGGAQPNISQEIIRSIDIPLPPLDEQRRIASRLNEQLAAVESARKAAEEQLHTAWQLPSAYLQELFGDSAKHKWNWQELGEVCELLPSKTIKSIGDTVVTAITTACLSENGFLPAGLKTSRMDANDAKQALVKEGEILIARSNTPDLVGRVSIYPGYPPNVVASDLTIRVWAGSACHPPFLTAYLSYLYLRGFWKEMAGGASGSMKKITRTQVVEVKIPVPDIETQKKTVAELQSKMDNFRQLTESLESQLAEINRLPASLLREAFAGQG